MFSEDSMDDLVCRWITVSQEKRILTLLEEFLVETKPGSEAAINLKKQIDSIDFNIQYREKKQRSKEAAARGETTIPHDRWGVHETHCCYKHGCKYGDVDCPVKIGLAKQEYPCESCMYD